MSIDQHVSNSNSGEESTEPSTRIILTQPEVGLVPPQAGLQEAFANGTYPEWVVQEAVKESRTPHILNDITSELEAMKLLSPEQRTEDYNWIVRYYSRSNKAFESTSLKLAENIGCPEEHIRSGIYDSVAVASHLLSQLKQYDSTYIVPIIEQVRNYLIQNFPNTNILFLGRDFCSAYLYIVNPSYSAVGMSEAAELKRENLFLANVSRYVRDVAIGGKTTELRMVLERIGLTKEVLLARGLLIADSCMQGKIPAIILKSLALGMNEMERYHFLTHAHVRYLKSSRLTGECIADKTAALAACNPGMGIRDIDLETLLSNKLDMIEEFRVEYPEFVQEYLPRRHKLFEWRPKVSIIAMGITVDPTSSKASLIADEPKTPSEKILCLLGLYAEIQLLKTAQLSAKVSTSPAPEHGDFNTKKMSLEIALLAESSKNISTFRGHRIGDLIVSNRKHNSAITPAKPGWFLKEIDKALENGVEGLREWQNKPNPRDIGAVAVMRTNDLSLPYELIINGETIYRFKDIVGEGNNVKVYLSEKGTIVKVIKDAKHVRKNLLLAWAEPLVREAGIRTAKVLSVSETGLYLEQEAMPGTSLEALYASPDDRIEGAGDHVPEHICEMALKDFHAAKKLLKEKDIWLDLKSANYHINTDNKLVNVDYAPRLNTTFYRYFQTDPPFGGMGPETKRRDLTDKEFLEKFFHHDTKKRCKRLAEEKK